MFDQPLLNRTEEAFNHTDPDDGDVWGPKRDPLYIVIPITVIYAVILVVGSVGNVSTCVVIARNKSMHTATNYYLFSLAVSDLLLLLAGLPYEMYYIWYKYPYLFGEAFCVMQGFAAETSANATVLTITAFTIERYVAICHPFLSHTMSKLSRAVKYIIVIWLLALCLAVPQAMSFGLVYRPLPGGGADPAVCICGVARRPLVPGAFELSSLVCFLAPMLLISVLYALIAAQLHRARVTGSQGNRGNAHRNTSVRLQCNPNKSSFGKTIVILEPSNGRSGALPRVASYGGRSLSGSGRKNQCGIRNTQQRATRHVVRMLVAVVAGFFVCWAPFHAQRLLAVYTDQSSGPAVVAVYTALTYVSGVLYYASTCVNPLLYNIMSNKFREAFKVTLARCCHTRRAGSIPRNPHVLSAREPCSGVLRAHSSSILRGHSSSALRTRDIRSNVSERCYSETSHGSQRYPRTPDMATVTGEVTTAVKVTTTAVRPLVVTFRSNCRRRQLVVEAPCVCQQHLPNICPAAGKSCRCDDGPTTTCDLDRETDDFRRDMNSLYHHLKISDHGCSNPSKKKRRTPPSDLNVSPASVVTTGDILVTERVDSDVAYEGCCGRRKRRYTSAADDESGRRRKRCQENSVGNKFHDWSTSNRQEPKNSSIETSMSSKCSHNCKHDTFYLKPLHSWYSSSLTNSVTRSRSCPGLMKRYG